MTTPYATRLSYRTIIRLNGEDRRVFLQGMVSNDVMKATATNAVYAALLTPQGKFLHDMFILEHEDSFLIDCEAARAEDLLKRLNAVKLRSKVSFENLSNTFDVWAVWNGDYKAPLVFHDQRLPDLGMRVFFEKNQSLAYVTLVDPSAYDEFRLTLGVADGSCDMEIGQSTLADGNIDLLHGVSWNKGCYIGQELTARMHHRGLVKKRMFPVRIEGDLPPPGTPVHYAEKDVGDMRGHSGARGLALIKIEALQQALREKKPLTCGNTRLWPSIPAWMKIDALPANR